MMTGYDPSDAKYRNRDTAVIRESGFDQIQAQERVSRLIGRQEEDEEQADEVGPGYEDEKCVDLDFY